MDHHRAVDCPRGFALNFAELVRNDMEEVEANGSCGKSHDREPWYGEFNGEASEGDGA